MHQTLDAGFRDLDHDTCHITPEITKLKIHLKMPLKINWTLLVTNHWTSDNTSAKSFDTRGPFTQDFKATGSRDTGTLGKVLTKTAEPQRVSTSTRQRSGSGYTSLFIDATLNMAGQEHLPEIWMPCRYVSWNGATRAETTSWLAPNLSTNIVPTNIAWVKLSGNNP